MFDERIMMERNDVLIESAFRHWREKGFPYPDLTPYDLWADFFSLQDSDLKIIEQGQQATMFEEMLTKQLEVKNDGINTANHFHPHIWESHALNMRSPYDAYLEDRALRKAIRLALETTGKLTDVSIRNKLKIVNGAQMCSNFRPLVAKAIYQRYLDGNRVLDPSTGYGGRLLGFLSIPGEPTYTGIDPSTKTCFGNMAMAHFFGASERVNIIQSPFEDTGELGEFDLAFTSPPYFRKEIYSEEPTQSCHRYQNFAAWLGGFWRPTISRVFDLLRPGGRFVINIQDVTIRKETYPLISETEAAMGRAGFVRIDTLEMRFPSFGKGLEKWKVEKVLVYERPAV